ncbi:MAG: thiamine pyrophosphate-dependent enzyme [Thermodesulfobacteriota bacterium]|nr:thiamine pyrophosphate-dependent enzyme [Thermodesulfobacteriota bacterium]
MTPNTIVKEKVYGKPKLCVFPLSPFCPGCSYGIIYKLIAENIEELGIQSRCITVCDVGCNVLMARGFPIDIMPGLHGRSMVVATGAKRSLPDAIVWHSGGDGAMGALGLGHMLNCMMRSEKITSFFLNNAGYGMTGGQLAPTTLVGLRTTTTPEGRNPEVFGGPIHIAELAAMIKGTAYAARVAVNTPANYQRAKKAIRTAFEKQINNVGYSIVEFITACPTDWGLTPIEANKFVTDKMLAEFPLGEFRNVDSIEYPIDEDVSKVGRTKR